MIASLEFMRRMFPVFNASIFDGALPLPAFRISSARSYRGQYRRERQPGFLRNVVTHTISLSDRFDVPPAEMEDVLIHEMLHMYIAVRKIQDNAPHGNVFRRMMADINSRHGRNIVVSHRHKEGEEPKLNESIPMRVSYLCVCDMADGRRLMARVASTRVHEIHRSIASWGAVKDEKWFASTEKAFQTYPAIRTLKLYAISPQAQDALENGYTREMEFADTHRGRVLRLKKSTLQ